MRVISLSALLWMVSLPLTGQRNVTIKTGSFPLVPQVLSGRQQTKTQYLFYTSDHLLTYPEQTILKEKGIEILYALQNNLYWVRVKSPQDEATSQRLFDLNPEYKSAVDPTTRATSNRFRVSVAYGLSAAEVNQWAIKNHITLLDQRALPFGLLDVQVPSPGFTTLLHTPWISYIQTIPHDEEVNYRAIHGERAGALISPLTRGLNGQGMTVGIGDGGRVQVHEDLSQQYLDLASFGTSSHATQTSGIVAGAGLIDPFFGFGYAPKAQVILRNFSDILWDAPQYVEDFGMTVTNNSYGSSQTDCIYMGDYDGSSAGLDAMINAIPSLLHVFSSGNSASSTCTPYTSGFATILSGYQPAKNVLTVGAIVNTDGIAGFSSRGPVDDGRLKPEVVAYGQQRFSTIGTNQYASNSGTSFSSPATAGSATLLYQLYRQGHNDSLPDAALIKNVLCNAADDLGNAGPDFIYGFGRINGDRAAAILEEHQYISLSVDEGSTLINTFSIPSGTAAAEVMILWTDPPSAPYETVNLVNDLDLTVVTPSGDTIRPWILNVTPAGVSLPATTGADHFNNYEQVTLVNPEAGMYTMVTKGYHVPLGPQKAWISWDIQAAGIKVQFPNGGEVLKPGNVNVANDRQYIRWDAFGTGSSTFTVEYSTNGGSSWTTLSSSVPAANRFLDWFPPNVSTDQLRVRVTAGGFEDVSDANAVIMAAPSNLVATSPCNGYAELSWTPMAGISLYKVFMIKNETLIPLDTVTGTSFVVHHLPLDTAIWLTVAGVLPSGAVGLRARAVQVTANGGNNCTWSNDLSIDSLIHINRGRKFTSTAFSTSDTITIHLTNLGTMDASGFSLHYLLDAAPVFTQAFPGTLSAGTGTVFSFLKPADLSAVGSYHLKIWTTYASDPWHENDTIDITLRQLDNPVISLPWTEDFESAIDTTVLSDMTGLAALDAWDVHLQSMARLRTHAGTPFFHSGHRALTVDAVRTGTSKNGELTLTLNLSAFDTLTDDLRLSFEVMHHEIIPDETNTEGVWIRGNDTLPFSLLTMIPNEASARGVWQSFAGLELSDTLKHAGQNFSSSFQIRFPFDVYATAGQTNSQDGETLDDIALDLIDRDISVTSVTHPSPIGCDLGTETIMAAVKNTGSTILQNASVSYRVNDGVIFTTFIGDIPADTAILVSLSPAYDFSASGIYDLQVWTSATQDDFPGNDTTSITVLHTSLVSAFPYLEGFENGSGDWLSSGIHSSWASGVPGKQNFSRAAEGYKVWATSLSGLYHQDELSYLYSPCFDLMGMTQPYLSFAWQYQLETNYDYAWVEYKLAGSNDWTRLGAQGSGVNWYNHASDAWNGSKLQWTSTGIAIPFTDTIIQFRWVMSSDVGLEMEGVALDQVHVYDRVALYTGDPLMMTQAVSGNDWVDFDSGDQRLFSIHPMGQDLGDVTLTLYKSGNNFQLSDSLYLLSRNWVLSATNPPVLPIQMRGYFTSAEVNNLINASGCSQCISARDAFDVAAVRYTGDNQDGNYANDTASDVTAYPLDSTALVPYDAGLYAQWNADGMSEWWISSVVTKWADTILIRVGSGTDDAEEHEFSGAVNPFRSSLAMTEKNGQQKVGWRFRHVTIPKNSYIQSAHLAWTSDEIHADTTHWTLQTELSANPPTFTTAKYNLSLRNRSDQVVQWSPEAWTAANTVYTSPEIKHLIQQVVDQSAWVTGHDLVILMKGDGLRSAWSYDGDSLKGAQLVVNYTNACNETGICYVDSSANGSQDGNSWVNAYRSLEQALDRTAHCADLNEIWIANGTYSPYFENSRAAGFSVRSGVKIYGGFQGMETDINQRVYGMYPTIISGDIGIPGLMTDNLYHVFTVQPGAEETLFDGLIIQDGLANGGNPDQQRGSGIYNSGGLKLVHVTINNSSAPSVYNAPGSYLHAIDLVEVKE